MGTVIKYTSHMNYINEGVGDVCHGDYAEKNFAGTRIQTGNHPTPLLQPHLQHRLRHPPDPARSGPFKYPVLWGT